MVTRKGGKKGGGGKVFLQEKPLELQIENLVCIYYFTLKVKLVGSHLATPPTFPV